MYEVNGGGGGGAPLPGGGGPYPPGKRRETQKLKQMNTKELLLESASSRWGKAVGWISNAGSAFYESSLWEIFVLQVSPL